MTGLAPGDLAHLDGDAVEALAVAYAERWTMRDELAAQQVELLYNLISVVLTMFPKGRPLPPFRIPRPSDRAAAAEQKVTPGQFARLVAPGLARG